MLARRFGRNIKLPSTRAIKHQVLTLMLEDHLNAQAPAAKPDEHLVSHGLGAAKEPNTI